MHKGEIFRDTLPKAVFEQIINDSKIKGARSILWAKFQLTASVFFFNGLRISETFNLIVISFEELFKTKNWLFIKAKPINIEMFNLHKKV